MTDGAMITDRHKIVGMKRWVSWAKPFDISLNSYSTQTKNLCINFHLKTKDNQLSQARIHNYKNLYLSSKLFCGVIIIYAAILSELEPIGCRSLDKVIRGDQDTVTNEEFLISIRPIDREELLTA